MSFKVPTDIARLSDAELADLIAEGAAEFESLLGLEDPADQDVIEAERVSPLLKQLDAEQQRRISANAGRIERMNAVRQAHQSEPDGDREPEPPQPTEPEEPPPAPPQVVAEPALQIHREDLVQAADETDSAFERRQGRYPAREPAAGQGESVIASNGVEVLPRVAPRPVRPQRADADLVITASADVPDFATGSRVTGVPEIAQMVVNRMRGFSQPAGQEGGQMHQYGICTLRPSFPEELICGLGDDDWSVVTRAANEARLPGGSLTAAGGGWCAPSETLYTLCEGETTDGMVSVPEVQVRRGGIRYTKGPDFSAIYTGVGFCMTEAQAIAGTTKPCYEVPCPSFQEVRLDACGLCIKVPILTNAAWPELVQRVIRGALVAFQHQLNAKVLTTLATALGAAVTPTGLGSTFGDTISALVLSADSIRTKYRLGRNETMEIVAPMWLLGAVQADLAFRVGAEPSAVSAAQVDAAFSSRNLNVQWVYDWQDLDTACPTDYPTTADVMIYPAGTFVKGVADVINLNAVYDAASLSQNYFTGLFMEQGILIAQTCYSGCLVTVPVCNAGRTGAGDLTCAVAGP